ncbi:MAG: type II secretion system F family protein [Firmicutes bacterium]|nr:type II secretion system F family protein [Bacillota bacterium]
MNFSVLSSEKSRIRKEKEKQREDIIKGLPSFINQLLLLMDTGLIITEAFRRIAREYERLPPEQSSYFTSSVAEILENSEKSGENVLNGFYAFAGRSDVKELIRTANFLYENKNRGTEIWDRLSDLADDLWEERKHLCMERIKVSETRMSFPLGIMLISLLLMTSAPALMQIR